MALNLIADPWIPVRCKDGARHVIAPWQMADTDLAFPDWPRPDLNVACLELLIGLVLLADPPEDAEDWDERRKPDPERLRKKLAPFAAAFELLGDGPRFLQDIEPLEGEPNPPDMLFIDSAGGNTARNNADLMVRRGRYPALEPALAAIALYTFQAFAPSGGAGNRTSMRGGGPMVTLVDPGAGLWPLVWANVPDGRAATPDVLPWMRTTTTSEKGQMIYPEQAHPTQAFFGMPRRLRLVGAGDDIVGVIQRPYGVNYAGWSHPLSPYYRLKVGEEWLPKHPAAGLFGYRNWLGIVAAEPEEDNSTRRRADMVRAWDARSPGRPARVLVAGWAMDNMKARDFIFSEQPLVRLDGLALTSLRGMIAAAEVFAAALRGALAPLTGEGESREAVREEFYALTQSAFEKHVAALTADNRIETAQAWVADMTRIVLDLFEVRALPGLGDLDTKAQRQVVEAHRLLKATLAGRTKLGAKAYGAMGLEPEQRREEAA